MTEVLRYAAFTSDPAGGNPAGVVLDAANLDDVARQAIATDIGYSETAFLERAGPRRFRLRFFSPLAEVAFCGHATIASAVVLAEREGPGGLSFDTAVGVVEIDTESGDGAVRASLRSVPTSSRAATDAELDAALEALGWDRSVLDRGYPPAVAFAGNDHLVLAVRTRRHLAALDYDFERLKRVMEEAGWTTLQIFWEESTDVFHARNPFPVGGVVEDPATGAAAAALGGYFRTIGRVAAPRKFTIIQGEDMGRRSVLQVTVGPDDARVIVSGCAVKI